MLKYVLYRKIKILNGPLLFKKSIYFCKRIVKEEVGFKVSQVTVEIVPDIYCAKLKKTSDQHLIYTAGY